MPECDRASTRPIVIFTIGTQGDVRPCVALAQGLHRAGYAVRIATSDNFAELVRRAGLEFYPLTANFQAMLEADRSIAEQGLNVRAMVRIFSRALYDLGCQLGTGGAGGL